MLLACIDCFANRDYNIFNLNLAELVHEILMINA